ncbi:MAG: NFYB/HAP3 family transcription factor subunit [Candidatus Micrarchaeota archaeon]|nr:NFYB/HAP3 family transcription factor subunit [Candidatus Micrarchaeota archaeon]
MTWLPLYDMDRIIREAGAERVGEDASKKLSEVLEDSANEIIIRARQLARYAGRKNIRREDILLARSFI